MFLLIVAVAGGEDGSDGASAAGKSGGRSTYNDTVEDGEEEEEEEDGGGDAGLSVRASPTTRDSVQTVLFQCPCDMVRPLFATPGEITLTATTIEFAANEAEATALLRGTDAAPTGPRLGARATEDEIARRAYKDQLLKIAKRRVVSLSKVSAVEARRYQLQVCARGVRMPRSLLVACRLMRLCCCCCCCCC